MGSESKAAFFEMRGAVYKTLKMWEYLGKTRAEIITKGQVSFIFTRKNAGRIYLGRLLLGRTV